METSKLRKFASSARQALIEQVSTRLTKVLADGSLARRESASAVAELEKRIQEAGQAQVVETVAYTWFNRFCALRYMDVNRYTRIGVLSPTEGQFQPEILAEAKMGHIDEDLIPDKVRQKVLRLLNESDPSSDPQGEAYRLLLVAVCNHYHSLMPFMFEKIADYTELLLPDDLLSASSIPAATREALVPDNCSPEHTQESVEVIGWLYQFYIAEKKDEVFAALKKGKKITPENIPAATQLFTPHWIVRYLVENSLGRLWMLNHPDSKLIERMDYYIKPEQPETDFLRFSSPEEIKICDPACGSGHMLTYAFDLLYAIYEEQGYQATDIPRLILTNNLYGVEIDPRAGALAAFALTMKAREKYRRFLSIGKAVQPNICVLENIKVDPHELDDYMDKVGRDLFSGGLQGVVNQWEEADNFGSLIRPQVTDVSDVLELLRERHMGENLFMASVHQQVLKALRQADYLSPKYHVVVANPPYMGGKNINPSLKAYAEKHFNDGRSDLFAAFVMRTHEFVSEGGYVGLMTPFTWMFLASYESFREWMLSNGTIQSLIRPEYHAFFDSAFVPLCTFCIRTQAAPNYPGTYVELSIFYGADIQSVKALEAIENPACDWRFSATTNELRSIPGTPIAFWASTKVREAFTKGILFADIATPRKGITTADNERFVRFWFEVAIGDVATVKVPDADKSKRWFPANKGGLFRKWYGNKDVVINWHDDGRELRAFKSAVIRNPSYYFREGMTWNDISSSKLGMRYSSEESMFEGKGPMAFARSDAELYNLIAYLNSSVAASMLSFLCPTLNFNVGEIARMPVLENVLSDRSIAERSRRLVEMAREDWDSSEMSWGFRGHSLFDLAMPSPKRLSDHYAKKRNGWSSAKTIMATEEQANNEVFASIYGLSDEVSTATSCEDITLWSNPSYRYDDDKSDAELEALLLADTMREFISYAVGCMLGRYSLDKPGLILANQGETADDYLLKVSNQTEPLDEDRAISEPDSVAFVTGAAVACFSCGDTVPTDEAAFVISECEQGATPLRGRPLIYCSNCAEGPQASYVTWKQPLAKFSVRQALDREWCEPDTLKKFISMAGCFGHRVPADPDDISFMPDDDNVIPLLEGDWFTDDISQRFKEFLKVTFGTEHYDENLTFLENALYPDNMTGKKRKTIRDYFLKEFYNHHLKLYKKRPIYWLFSSPKGTFNALIYMHRYRPDTVSVVLSYLRDFRDKLTHHTAHLQSVADRADGSKSDKTKALKQINEFKKQLKELDDYERTTLFPLAQKQIPIDLDDGVKVNYPKFGAALKKIPGLEKKED